MMRGVTLRRALVLALTGLVLYGVAPAIGEVLGAWDRLDDVEPLWWVGVLVTQLAGLICLWDLQRLAVQSDRWFPVITSNLAGGALGRAVPGGAATAAALQFRMLRQAGIDAAAVGTGVTAGSILLVAALAGLPLLALPAVIGGLAVPGTLWQATLFTLAVFAVLFAVGALLLTRDGAILFVGRILRAVGRRTKPKDPPAHDLPEQLVAQRDVMRRALGRRWIEALATSVGRWVFDFLTLVAALEAAGANPNLFLALLAYAAAQLLAQVPITPGGLGVVEAGMTATLALAGVGAGSAALATLAYRLASYWLQLPAGLVAWLLHRRRYPVEVPA